MQRFIVLVKYIVNRNEWKSLVYSKLGTIVSPLANTYETHPITNHLSA